MSFVLAPIRLLDLVNRRHRIVSVYERKSADSDSWLEDCGAKRSNPLDVVLLTRGGIYLKKNKNDGRCIF